MAFIIIVYTLSIGTYRPDHNSLDPDQTPQNAASDQGLHCLLLISFELINEMKLFKF